jgi:hypothetical protein
MSFPTINPNHAFAVSAGTYTAATLLTQLDTILHIVASLVVIGSGLIVFFRKK